MESDNQFLTIVNHCFKRGKCEVVQSVKEGESQVIVMAQTRSKNGQSATSDGSGEDQPSPVKSRKDLVVSGIPMKTWARNILLGIAASVLTMAAATYLVVDGHIKLSGSVNPEKLNGFGLKAEFVFRNLILGVIWLLFNILLVITKRKGRAIDPLAGHEDLTLAYRNILTNSLEQFVISIVTQLSLISYLSGPQVVKIIPLLNFFYFFGRIFFTLGYPKFRTFGFVMTAIPSGLAALYSFYKYGVHLGIY